MRFKVVLILILAFVLSSCASDQITYKVSNVYGDEHVQYATIEFLQGSSAVQISDATIDYLDENSSGGGSSIGSQHSSITSQSIKGFANPEVIDLKISGNIKTKNGDDLPYSFQDKITVDPVEKCMSYVTDGPASSDKKFVLTKIHISPRSVVISGLGTLEKDLDVEVQNSLGESFSTWESSSKLQEEDIFMFALSFFRKIDHTNITTIIIDGIPYKVVPGESDSNY